MARRTKNSNDSSGGTPAWMVTYGDMMTLLLTFFVLIVSFSSMRDAEFRKAMGSLRGSLGLLGQQEYIISLGKIIVPEERYAFMSRRTMQTTGEISRKLNFVSEYENVQIYEDDRGLNIVLPAKILFGSGNDSIKEEAKPLLKKIGAFLYEVKKNDLMIEGHTDNAPIHTVRFPSNWHLSSARAISVTRFFSAECAIKNARMVASGYGEYQPLVPNDSDENREINRRVNILIRSEP